MIRAERIVGRDDQGEAGVDAREFFDDDGVIDILVTGPAEIFRKNGTEKTELTGFFYRFKRKGLILVPSRDVGRDFGFSEIADGTTQLDLLLSELEIHRRHFGCRKTSAE